jgi:uncharacterized protein (TIGR03083 family)
LPQRKSAGENLPLHFPDEKKFITKQIEEGIFKMATTKTHGLSQQELFAHAARMGRAEGELFRDYLLKLPEKKWNNMSFCTEWTIQDVAEHNVISGLVFLESLEAVANGLPNLPRFDRDDFARFEQRVEAMSRSEMAHQIAADTHRMYDILQSFSPEQLATDWPTRFGMNKVGNILSIRLTELALHSWDVRVVDDLTARLNRDTLRVMVPGTVNFLGGLADKQIIANQPNLTYQFELTGAVPGPVTFKIEDGKPIATPDLEGDPVAYLKMDSDAFLRLAWGRLRLDWMIKNGWIKVEGDQEAALKLPQIFSGMR